MSNKLLWHEGNGGIDYKASHKKWTLTIIEVSKGDFSLVVVHPDIGVLKPRTFRSLQRAKNGGVSLLRRLSIIGI